MHIPVEQVGFHPANRDGQPPNGARCMELLRDIMEIGFDSDEANAGGIVVASPPGNAAIHNFNKTSCDLDPFLAPVVAGSICYGSLSHSRLHQILRNIKYGVARELSSLTDSAGLLNLERVRVSGSGFVVGGLGCGH